MKKFLELITEDNSDKLSHTKVWSNVGSFVATVLFIYQTIYQHFINAEIFTIYLSAIVIQRSVSKIASNKYKNQKKEGENFML